MSETEGQGAVITALIRAAKAMPSLAKTETNTHGKYNFVGIDDYYAKAARCLLDEGLLLIPRETSREIMPTILKYGSVATGYSFNLLHAETGAVWQDFFRCTIQHPLSGAQDAGSSLSYADKLCLRHCFKIVTGEADADSTDNSSPEAPVADTTLNDLLGGDNVPVFGDPVGPGVPLVSESQAAFNAGFMEMFPAGVLTFLPDAETEAELEEYWHSNIANLDTVKSLDPECHTKLVSAFKTRRLEIKKAAKGK